MVPTATRSIPCSSLVAVKSSCHTRQCSPNGTASGCSMMATSCSNFATAARAAPCAILPIAAPASAVASRVSLQQPPNPRHYPRYHQSRHTHHHHHLQYQFRHVLVPLSLNQPYQLKIQGKRMHVKEKVCRIAKISALPDKTIFRHVAPHYDDEVVWLSHDVHCLWQTSPVVWNWLGRALSLGKTSSTAERGKARQHNVACSGAFVLHESLPALHTPVRPQAHASRALLDSRSAQGRDRCNACRLAMGEEAARVLS